ncbi:hypothetical protein BKI52_11145 [marine bacterium AO1-C]|nr:hypothetical protein BKI52_11145 [marine bacterium AO1-C]
MKYFLKRTLAYFIDCSIAFSAIMLILQWAILSNIRGALGLTDAWFRDGVNVELYVLTTISLPVWIYFIYFDSKKSKGTFGKRIMKLAVQDAQQQRISVGKSLARVALKLAPWEIIHLGLMLPTPIHYQEEPEIGVVTILGIVLFVGLALSILLNANQQSLYDRLTGTQVIEVTQ